MVKRFFQLAFIMLFLLSLFLSLSPASNDVPIVWNDKLIHCISYFMLMATLDFSWQSGRHLWVKSIFVLSYSAVIEYGQGFVPGRDVSLADMMANALGIILFVLLVPLFKRGGFYRFLKLT